MASLPLWATDSQQAQLSSGISHPGNICETSLKYAACPLVLATQRQQQQQQQNVIMSQTS